MVSTKQLRSYTLPKTSTGKGDCSNIYVDDMIVTGDDAEEIFILQ
jgi:hypothetical protein